MISSKKSRDEEWHWIESMKSGDSRAYSHFFQLLYEKHSGRLFTLCLGYSRCREDAEEELQEIFITLMRGLPFFRNEASFSTWSTRIAINHLKRAKKKKNRAEEVPFNHETMSTSCGTHLDLVLSEVISQLPDTMRLVFLLHDRLGLNHSEIADIIGLKVGSSRSLLCRARMELRNKLTRVRHQTIKYPGKPLYGHAITKQPITADTTSELKKQEISS